MSENKRGYIIVLTDGRLLKIFASPLGRASWERRLSRSPQDFRSPFGQPTQLYAIEPCEDMRTASGAAPDANAMMHESLTGLWWLAEILWKRQYNWAKRQWERRPNLGRPRTIPPGSLIHESAYKRGGEYAKRLPPDAIPTR